MFVKQRRARKKEKNIINMEKFFNGFYKNTETIQGKRDILLSFESQVILLSNPIDFCSLSTDKENYMGCEKIV